MKKILVFLFCLLIVNSLIFADVTLTLNTTVQGENLLKLSSSPLRLGSVWNNADENLTLTFASPTAQNAYVNLRTNNYTTYYINLLGVPLSSNDSTNKIGYTVTPIAGEGYTIGESLVVNALHANDSIEHCFTFPLQHGMRVVPAQFSVGLNQTDWENSGEGAYSGTVTFSLTTN
jgi:hypothetical protein